MTSHSSGRGAIVFSWCISVTWFWFSHPWFSIHILPYFHVLQGSMKGMFKSNSFVLKTKQIPFIYNVTDHYIIDIRSLYPLLLNYKWNQITMYLATNISLTQLIYLLVSGANQNEEIWHLSSSDEHPCPCSLQLMKRFMKISVHSLQCIQTLASRSCVLNILKFSAIFTKWNWFSAVESGRNC